MTTKMTDDKETPVYEVIYSWSEKGKVCITGLEKLSKANLEKIQIYKDCGTDLYEMFPGKFITSLEDLANYFAEHSDLKKEKHNDHKML